MITAITITLGWWIIPALITLVCLGFIIKFISDLGNSSGILGGIDALFALMLTLIPLGFVWAIYFAILYFTKH